MAAADTAPAAKALSADDTLAVVAAEAVAAVALGSAGRLQQERSVSGFSGIGVGRQATVRAAAAGSGGSYLP